MSENPENNEIILEGVAASPGVAQGKAFIHLQHQLDVPCYAISDDQADSEVERLDQAILKTRSEISEVRNKVAQSLGEDEALIFDAHLMVLEDNALIDEVISEVRSKCRNVEYGLKNVVDRYIDFFNTVEDEYLRERVADIRDVYRRLMHNLTGTRQASIGNLGGESIIISEDLSPSDAAGLDREKLIGFATDVGGKTSHSVIMARSLGIPAVVGLHDASKQVKAGDDVLVDGYDGILIINPSETRLFRYGKMASEREKLDRIYRGVLGEVSETADGRKISIMANIEGAQEMSAVSEMRADGVGLFRTEGIFLRHRGYPSEAVQYEEYAAAARSAEGRPVIIRTLDIGGDKTLGERDDDSFLGFRAIRFCLANPDIFKLQLRAILRASVEGNVKMMYPMISGPEELKEANALLDSVKGELRDQGIAFDDSLEVGAMIEIPSAVTVIDLLAKEVSFFSVGTNDLIQYLMAVDRLNDRVAHLYEPTHPAVLRTLKQIIDGAAAVDRPVGVCGEIAGDPMFAALLVGLGADSLSLNANMIPELKYGIRKMKAEAARALAEELMRMDDATEIRRKMHDFLQETVGQPNGSETIGRPHISPHT